MTRPIKILASCRTQATLEAVQGALGGVTDARLEAYNGALVDIIKTLGGRRRIDLMVLDVDLGDDAELETLTEVIDRSPAGVPIIATSAAASVDRVRLLMRLGLADFVPQPIVGDDLVNSIAVARRLIARQGPGHDSGGRVIAFLRSAGGMGATTLAVQSACALAQERNAKNRVCLIDLDIHGQAAGLYLNIDAANTIADCLIDPERMDAMLLKGVVSHHKAGFDLLAAPKTILPIKKVKATALEALLDVAREEYDFLLLDMPPVWMPWSDAVLSNCDLIVLVTQVGVAGIRQTRRQLATLAERHLGAIPTLVVANRYRRQLFGRGVGLKEAEKALGRPIDACVASHYKLVSEAHDVGVPVGAIKRGTRFERDVKQLTQLAQRQLSERAAGAAATRRLVS